MSELKRKMQFMVFGLLSLFVIVVMAAVNAMVYVQQSQLVSESLSGLRELADARYQRDDFHYVSDLPAAIVLFDRQGNIAGVFAGSDIPDEEELVEDVYEQDPPNLYVAGCIHEPLGQNGVLLLWTDEIAGHLWHTLAATFGAAAVAELALWFLVRRLTANMIRPIEQTFEKQRQFVSDASHELKTPLAVIMASAEAMQADPEPKWLDNIVSEAEQMNRLITDLLDLSRSEKESQFEEVNLSQTVESAALAFEGLLYERDLKLALDVEPDLMMEGSEDELYRLTAILVDNASRHAFKDTEVTVELFSEKDARVLRVTDTGDEIPDEEKEKIFERFYRVDSARTHSEGRYGLGLAMAKNIAQGHNARIQAESKDGKTTFEVRFASGTKRTGER